METETLFTTTKWRILQIIAKQPSAPLEIANALGTTTANISQQLRLLEAAGLVAKTRVSNSEAGMPRALFSLTRNFAQLNVVTNGLAKKKLISLSPLQVAISRVWLLEDLFLSTVLTAFFSTQENIWSKHKKLFFDSSSKKEIILLGDGPQTKTQVQSNDGTTTITIKKGSQETDDRLIYNT
jgi:DNA-binding HxlR family transcriptional regulator